MYGFFPMKKILRHTFRMKDSPNQPNPIWQLEERVTGYDASSCASYRLFMNEMRRVTAQKKMGLGDFISWQ